ncbi:dense core granule exocytosis [Homalodisca vitripennis]|nr:dense core granule exocytosis [Homalodisca vitripennis]
MTQNRYTHRYWGFVTSEVVMRGVCSGSMIPMAFSNPLTKLRYGRYCFPFGRPEGALKATLSLLERVLMKDIATPVPPEDVRGLIKKCLETAAYVNYTRLSAEAKIEGNLSD